MEKRRFGRTNHQSTVAIFGGAALWDTTQFVADRAMEQVIAAGVNHIDVAPSYGKAEELIGPWMPRVRKDFFLGCKTLARTKQGAWGELQRSLERLRVDAFDLYQIHAITSLDQLDEALRPDGVLDAMLEARAQGLTKYIGITGHGNAAPTVFMEALRRFDFDSILFPINLVQFADASYRASAQALLQECRKRDVGTLIIKAVGKGVWREQPRTHTTWYVPFDTAPEVQTAVNFALSQDVTGLCTAGDLSVLPLFLDACAHFEPMRAEEQAKLIATAEQYESVFALNGP
ncbi:MAG: aldo/keto reductase [Chloroflexi bacterium]|nr:aldo/keto reductase [Chloroflexota bacterium]